MRFGWSAYVIPVLFVFSPSLILMGAPGEILLAAVTATVGVWLISAAMAGFFVGPLSPVVRSCFGFAGLLALVPAGAFAGAVYSDLAGVGFGTVLIGMEIAKERRRIQHELG